MCDIMVPDMIAPDAEMESLSHRIFNNLGEVLDWIKE